MKLYIFVNAYITGGQLAYEAPSFDTLGEAWSAMLERIDSLIDLASEIGVDPFELEQEYIVLADMSPQELSVTIAGELFEVQALEGATDEA